MDGVSPAIVTVLHQWSWWW